MTKISGQRNKAQKQCERRREGIYCYSVHSNFTCDKVPKVRYREKKEHDQAKPILKQEEREDKTPESFVYNK